MSIIKDNANGGKRIVRFANGLIPKTDASGNLISGGSGRYAQAYANMGTSDNNYFEIDGNPSANDSILLTARIPENENGYFFGCFKSATGEGIGLWLRKNGNQICFKCGGSTSEEVKVDWSEGFHTYGFIASENGGIRFLYDGEFRGGSGYTSPLTSSDNYYVGRCNRQKSLHPNNVLISKVVAITDKTYHYYPTASSASGGLCGWYETRVRQSVVEEVGNTPGEIAPYGVSIEDLKEMTGSGYHDLFALAAEDNGMPLSQADAVYKLTKTGEDDRAFAFCLTDIPIPSGWSRASRSGDRFTYEKGDLICGRNTRWNIWADGMTFGKWIDPVSAHFQFGYEFRCNIYHRPNSLTANSAVNLQDFEGLSISAHTPKMELSSNDIEIEYHNGYQTRCTVSDAIPEYSTGVGSLIDDSRIFYPNKALDNTARMRLGNLADWYQDLPSTTSATNAITGMAASMQMYSNGAWILVAYAMGRTNIHYTPTAGSDRLLPFCNQYRTNPAYADMLALFRDGHVSASDTTEKVWPMQINPEMQELTVYDKLYAAGASGLQSRVELAGVNGTLVDFYYELNEQLIHTYRIVPEQIGTIKGRFNPRISTSATTYRCILKTPSVTIGGTTYYIYPVWSGGSSGSYHRTKFANGFGFYFCLLNGPVTDTASRAVIPTSGVIPITIKTYVTSGGSYYVTEYSGVTEFYTSGWLPGEGGATNTRFPNSADDDFINNTSKWATRLIKYEKTMAIADNTTIEVSFG